jgi:hypothetical protein
VEKVAVTLGKDMQDASEEGGLLHRGRQGGGRAGILLVLVLVVVVVLLLLLLVEQGRSGKVPVEEGVLHRKR